MQGAERPARRGLLALSLLAPLACALGWWWVQRAPAPLPVAVVAVERGSVVDQLIATGRVVNARRMTVTALQPGRIQHLHAAPGDRVAAAAPLAELDAELADNSLRGAELRREAAADGVERARYQLDLSRRTHQQDLGRAEDVVQRRFDLGEARRALAQAENALARAQIVRRRTQVQAPFEALVVERYVDIGQWVDEGNALFALAASGDDRVEVLVDAGDYAAITPGTAVSLRAEAYPDAPWPAAVQWLAPSVSDDDANRFVVHVSLDDSAPPLLLGQRIEADIELARRDAVLRLPVQHLRYRDGKSGVWRLIDERLVWTAVRTGLQNDRWVELLGGLDEGDRVLAAGQPVPERAVRAAEP